MGLILIVGFFGVLGSLGHRVGLSVETADLHQIGFGWRLALFRRSLKGLRVWGFTICHWLIRILSLNLTANSVVGHRVPSPNFDANWAKPQPDQGYPLQG